MLQLEVTILCGHELAFEVAIPARRHSISMKSRRSILYRSQDSTGKDNLASLAEDKATLVRESYPWSQRILWTEKRRSAETPLQSSAFGPVVILSI